jgi:hypothetical protein
VLRANSGIASLLGGDIDAAQEAFREELGLSRVVAPRFAGEALNGLAAVAAIRNDTVRAARLAGAAAVHRDDGPQDEVEARLDTAFIQPARRRQGADAWDAAARDGGKLSFEDAVTYALRSWVSPVTALDRPQPINDPRGRSFLGVNGAIQVGRSACTGEPSLR